MRQEEIGRIIISKGGGGGASNTTTAVGSNSSINVTTIMSPISKNVIVTNNRSLSSAAGFSFKSTSSDDQMINDRELAQRKAEETAWRRNEATEWLREMDKVAWRSLPSNPSEEQFCRALRNGLILCNVLNKVNPGAVLKVVEIPIVDVQSTEGAAQSAIQYFENMRNFLVAVKDMKLLTFEASDLEKGGSSGKVVDCILCLKGYYEWKQAGGIGVWRYGGLVKIVSLPKGSPPSSFLGSESADESFDDSESSQYEQLLEFLHLSNEVSIEESKTANALAFLFDNFGLGLLQAYLREGNGIDELPLNAMVIDTLLSKVVKDFSALLVSQGTQLGLFLKKILKGDIGSLSRAEFMEAISQYLQQRTSMVSNDFSKFCICGGKREIIQQTISHSSCDAEVMDLHKRQIKELRLFYRETKQEVKQIQAGWKEEVSRLEHYIKSLEVASSSYHKVLEENRQLYNQVQDLKGTIRVYCRVRPFLSGQPNVQSTVDYIGENGNIMIANPLKHGKDARKVFSFNKVFGTNVSQEQIYADTQPLVRSVLDGYNVCIFAYGQTGSGKTYTMNGPDLSSAETCGVNYRALSDLFQISKTRMDAIKYEVGVQMIEIYNEQVRDLLVSDGSNRRLDIRNNSQLNGLNVPDASWLPVSSTQDVLELMRIGQRNRAVGATALNERSSRSHSILTVHVYGRELVSGSVLKGCLHLVDLAGSERVDKSEALGERLKEAQHINRSLSALGDVIAALAQKSVHVPYRNSKLTQVLQDSLGGHAKTLMFVHINPEVSSIGETISTLKFAEKVSSIELGAARSYKEAGDVRELKEEISNLKQALERKEAELEQVKAGNGTRNTPELQRPRAVSPFFMPRCGLSANLKPEICQRPNDEMRNLEDRSCSSGKQRRSRFPSALTDKETLPKIPSFGKERLASTTKARSPSPPIRRSISTDRGAHIRGRVKAETVENQPVAKVPFPARVPVSKSIATIPMIPSTDGNSKVQHTSSQEPVKQVKAETVENQLVAKVPFPSRVPVSKSIATIPMIPSTDGNSKVQHTSSQEPVKQVKAETVENQLVAKVPFPCRVPVSKSIATIPIIPSTDGNSKVQHTSSQEPVKQVNISGAFYNLHKVSSGKVHAELEAEQFCLANNIREGGISSRRLYTEHEEEQFRQALNIRQGGIRKSKNESKAKGKHQLPAAKFQKSDVRMAMPFDVEKTEEPRKSEFSEPENEHLLPMSPKRAALNVKMLQKSLSRNSQNLELRGMAQSMEPVLAGKLENKVPNNPIRNAKEGANTSMPELRRSRSTPRGKFFILP